jgi:YggT family protein
MRAILLFIDQVLIQLLIYIIIASAIMSWLMAFNVINPYNQFVRTLWNAFNVITEPMLRPIRRWLPDFGGIDISPMILILGLILIRYIINYEILPRLA